MKADELREMNLEELTAEENRLGEALFNLKVRKSMGQLENPMQIRLSRRDLARVKTFVSAKKRMLI